MKLLKRPQPPPEFSDPDFVEAFVPAPEVVEWLRAIFLDPESPLYDEAHTHLNDAHIGCLWTNAVNVTKQVEVVGMAEIPKPHPALGKWAKARFEQQMREWFGWTPLDFLITLSAPYLAKAEDMLFCAVGKHELCHCGQALDEYEQPKFRKKDGRPVFAIRDHDFAGFLSVVRDFGPGAERNVPVLAEILKVGPRISEVDIRRMCGTCLLRAV
ncbi:MAG TPA: putative metallopeptidase [Pyrinomonadaceae bacterium]|jgi:hypothetical protein